jgi:hypothetical protein
MVDFDGRNRYPNDDIWLTDGYGDYVRHYLRAMASAPELAPRGQDHLLRSTSVVKRIVYGRGRVEYETAEPASQELLRIAFEPARVAAGGQELRRLEQLSDLGSREGYTFDLKGDSPGVLRIAHRLSGQVSVERAKNIP